MVRSFTSDFMEMLVEMPSFSPVASRLPDTA